MPRSRKRSPKKNKRSPKKNKRSPSPKGSKTTRHNGNKLVWQRGTGNKKYKVTVFYKNGTKKTVQFGDKRYQQFRDKTPLKLYTSKNHLDT